MALFKAMFILFTLYKQKLSYNDFYFKSMHFRLLDCAVEYKATASF